MQCKNCGKENREDARFCAFCGSSLGGEAVRQKFVNESGGAADRSSGKTENLGADRSSAEETLSHRKKPGRRGLWIVCIVLALTGAAVGGILFFGRDREEKQYEALLDSGNHYLAEMDYKEAEDCYLQAISIDPKQKEPYLRLIDIYIKQEAYDRIVETAEQARDEVPPEERQEFEEIIETWEDAVGYTWIVEAKIEAEDINYICGLPYETSDHYIIQNDGNAQYMSSYAVITAEGLTRLINLDGELLEIDGAVWDSLSCYRGGYLIDTDSTMVAFDGETLGQWTGGAGFAGMNWYYFCEDFYDAWNPKETPVIPRALPIAIALPVTDSVLTAMPDEGLGEWFLQNTAGYMILNNGEFQSGTVYDECGPSREGVMAVCKDGKWGYVTEEGEEIIPAEYEPSWTLIDAYTGQEREYCYAASDGFIVLTKDGGWELRRLDGTSAIPAGVFEAIRPVYEGKCWVKKDGRWGVIQLENSDSYESGISHTVEKDIVENQIKIPTKEEVMLMVTEHYNILEENGGSFVVFEDEVFEIENGYSMALRYRISDEAADEIIRSGGMPAANRLVGTIKVNIQSGEVKFSNGIETSVTWNLYEE